jgi:magnesium transporter
LAINIFTSPDSPFQWIDITAPTEQELIDMSEKYGIHRYSIRDCMEADHLPKLEHVGDYSFIISRLYLVEKKHLDETQTIQELTTKLAFFYNVNVLITVHRLELSFLEEIKEKFLDTKYANPSSIVVRSLWYVMYSFEKPSIDLMKEIDIYEEKIFLRNLSPTMMKKLYFIKRKTHSASKLLTMSHGIISGIDCKDNIALNDLRDLHQKLSSMFNQNYEDINSLLNFYLSISSQKTNEVMRILTVFSAFFLPLTFIAGVYGMNFDYLPELHIKEAYPMFWIICVLITIIIFQWFWRKKWL